MPFDRFMIAAPAGGLQNDVKPWLIMDDAFEKMNNAYVFRGRVRKRYGSRLLSIGRPQDQLNSRLRINVGTTNAITGNLSGTVPAGSPIANLGQMFSIGIEMYTVVTAGNQPMLDTGATTTADFNTANGNFVFVGAPLNTAVFYYPGLPVMGLIPYEIGTDLDVEKTMAFDTRFAYIRSAGGWVRATGGADVWTGSDSQFFWCDNFVGDEEQDTFLFVTNNDAADPNFMRFWDGSTWTSFNPAFSTTSGNTVVTCLIIVSFKDRLLLLNTTENNSDDGNGLNYRNRLRYSKLFNATDTNAFYEQPPGLGGVLDNTGTQEAIVSAEFIKDRLIVFYERSTWEVVYTGNSVSPFRWQKINTELGAQSTFSTIPFDRQILTFGETGIHACNGANVERIDQKIPNEVFDINIIAQGVERVYGIRDYYNELTYWTFPDETGFFKYPTRVLVYNYKTGSWAFNDETITAFGYFWNEATAGTWETTPSQWAETTFTWNASFLNFAFRSIIAGNQQGWTFLLDQDLTINSPQLYITNMFRNGAGEIQVTVINHNLPLFGGQAYIEIIGAQGVTGVDNVIFQPLIFGNNDPNNFTIIAPNFAGVYTGGGVIRLVSRIDIKTKQYNFYLDKGRNIAVSKIDFLVENSANVLGDNPQIRVSSYASASSQRNFTQILDLGPYDLYPQEIYEEYFWHPIYTQVEGSFIQLSIFYSNDQMLDLFISSQDFQLHAMTFYTEPTSDRLQS